MGDLHNAIDRAIMVLKREQENAREALRKFEPGGNLYTLIEQHSYAAQERVNQIDQEIHELGQAIEYLERDR